MLDTSKIIQKNLSQDQYFIQEYPKHQIFIHHTAGGANPNNVIAGWQATTERVATAFVIAGKEDNSQSYHEGDIFQCFSSKFWSYHLGMKTASNLKVAHQSIAIEICNWGQLTYKDGKFWNYVNREVPQIEVIELAQPFRGYKYFHKYTDKQLASLKDLLIYLCNKWSIPKKYNDDMFDLNYKAINGEEDGFGIWTHVSVRQDKVDCFPQHELITMLQEVENL